MTGQLALAGTEKGTAIFSPCRRWRYVLERRLRSGPRRLAMLLVNPSKAGEEMEDPTSRKGIGFAWRLDFDVLVIVNPFALVSTDVRGLLTAADPIGPDNDLHLARELSLADMVIAGWGRKAGRLGRLIDARAAVVAKMVPAQKLHALRILPSGHPEHPLMLPYDLTPVLYRGMEMRR